ncbi:hypothetical protein V1525DRAFT_400959 [Lipomyces kononenkoae]|uniref:Uncharacterized protein n=1 Tax=Lipomyces kononenkoae TaxID=34357 RepID=A0ACC3T3B7_LIPKO
MTTSIRALFQRSEAAKKVEHPFAKYVNDKLKCSVCDLFISNQPQWDAHIGTPTHRDAVQRFKVAQQRKAKRQLDANTQTEAQGSQGKRLRREEKDTIGQLPRNFFDDGPPGQSTNNALGTDQSKVESASSLDAEWTAFQKDIAKLQAGTVVEAVASINQQLQTNTESSKGEDDDDIMDEVMNELHDQFDEQKTLESRVLKLKEMREKLRVKNVQTSLPHEDIHSVDSNRNVTGIEKGEKYEKEKKKEKEKEDDDDDDEEDEGEVEDLPDEYDEYLVWRRKGI